MKTDSSIDAGVPPAGRITPMRPRSHNWTGVTLFLVVLGLVGVSALPGRQGAASARASVEARVALTELRAAVEAYEREHERPCGVAADGTVSALWFRRQLTLATTRDGSLAGLGAGEGVQGPYLRRIPLNPLSQRAEVRVLGIGQEMPGEADGACGWIYDPVGGALRLNAAGRLASGQAYFDL